LNLASAAFPSVRAKRTAFGINFIAQEESLNLVEIFLGLLSILLRQTSAQSGIQNRYQHKQT